MKKTPLAKAYELIEEGCFGDLLKRKTELLEEERQNLIEFHVEVMKKGLDNEKERGWSDAVEKNVRDTAETYLTENYEQ